VCSRATRAGEKRSANDSHAESASGHRYCGAKENGSPRLPGTFGKVLLPSRASVQARRVSEQWSTYYCLTEFAGSSFFAGGCGGKLNVKKPVIGFLSCAKSSTGNSHCRAAVTASRFISGKVEPWTFAAVTFPSGEISIRTRTAPPIPASRNAAGTSGWTFLA